MLNKLKELRDSAEKHGLDLGDLKPLQLDPSEPNNDRELVGDFMSHMLGTQKLLGQVEQSNKYMKEQANRLIYEKYAQQEVKKAQLDQIIQSTKDCCAQIQSHLNFMKNDITESEKLYKNEPETRVKRTVHRTFTHKFHDLVRMSQTLQSEFKNSLNSKVKGQIRVFHPNVTEDQLNEMKEDPEAALKLIMEQVMGPAHPQLKQTVAEIQNKFEAILRLEKSVNELFELFQEMATLVKAQGEMLENIEMNLEETEHYLERAEVKLEQADQIQKENRKKMGCFICCLSMAALIFVVMVSGVIGF